MRSMLDSIPIRESLAVDNSATLLLEDSGTVYGVESGTAFLFAAQRLGDRTGSRYHIATVGAGEIFFALPAPGDSAILVAGTLNTRIALMEATAFFGRCADGAVLEAFEPALAEWIAKLTENLRSAYESERGTNRLLEGSGEYPADERLYASSVRWVAPDEGVFAFNGIALRDWMGTAYFPVTQKQTVSVKEDQDLRILDTASLARAGTLRETLSAYHLKTAALLCAEKRESHAAEDARIREKFRRADRAFAATLEQVGSLLGPRDRLTAAYADEEARGLFGSAKLVAQTAGIALTAIPGKEYTSRKNGVEEIAKDNNVRVRRVLLRGEWWKEDGGPLLGFSASAADEEDSDATYEAGENGKPVALIPKNGNAYLVIDPETGARRLVDRGALAGLTPIAYMFYLPFPNKRLGIRDILAYTAEGLKADIARYVVLGLLGTLIGLLVPEITKIFTDTIIPEAAKNQMGQLTFLIVLSFLTAGLFDFIKGFAMTRLETKSDVSLQAAVMDRVIKLPVPFFRDFTAGDLSERTLAISQIRRILSGMIMASLMSFLFSLVYLVQLFRYSGTMAVWGLWFCLASILVTAAVGALRYRFDKRVADLQGSITGTLLQFMIGIGKLNITASEKRAFGVWAKKFIEKKKLAFKSGLIDNFHAAFTSFFPLVVTTLFYLIFMNGIRNGGPGRPTLSTGTFLAFMASFTAFQTALIGMTTALTQSIQVIPLYARARPILDGLPEVLVSKPAATGLKGNIEVSHVDFRYEPEGPLILKDVSLKVAQGEFVALVGGSGSGKSTLLRLLLGFEKAESGSIYFDNKDLDSYDISSVRRQMGVVLQNGSILQGSIYKNIVGSTLLTIDDAWEAARLVGLEQDIRDMPMGMHTELPAGGGTLSGGQKQRLVIARAIVRRPNILFFDEATSALDNRTQAVVSQSLESLNVTRIVIAHRLSTVIKADRIYVLQNGVIEESGKYQDLMDRKGFFYELAARQQI